MTAELALPQRRPWVDLVIAALIVAWAALAFATRDREPAPVNRPPGAQQTAPTGGNGRR